jgi:kynurenine formamidase
MTQDWLAGTLRGRKVFDLGVELYHGMPHHPMHSPFMYQMLRTHGDLLYGDGVTAAVDIFGMSCHTGTHLDGLGHFAKNLCLHGGVPVDQGQSKTEGIKTCGIQEVDPILRRGILLDVAGTQGVDLLGAQQTIGPAELEAAAKTSKVQVQPGDVVLVRTGWISLWPDSRKYYSVQSGQPGLTPDGARWVTDQGAFCIGSDNFAVEYVPSPGNTMPVHVHCLVEKGVHLLEVVNLEELARTRTAEFLLILVPMKIRGGTASPVRPLAVV